MPRPDPELLLAALPAEDRAAVERWLYALGLEPSELTAVPGLFQAVQMVAVTMLAGRMEGIPRAQAFEEAQRALGTGDVLRGWYRLQQRALRQTVSDEEAAA